MGFTLLLLMGLAFRVGLHYGQAPDGPRARSSETALVESGFQTAPSIDFWTRAQKRVEWLQEQCPLLRTVRGYLVRSACDICELLPVLEAYMDETGAATESGGQNGFAAVATLNRHLQQYGFIESSPNGPLLKLHRYVEQCPLDVSPDAAHSVLSRAGPSPPQAVGARIRTLSGDDVKKGLPFGTTPLLLIDAVHNADQVYKELEALSTRVKRWIVLHDTESFRERDENEELRRNDVPVAVSMWRGLYQPVAHFLQKYRDEWEEEAYFRNNHGLVVLRRKGARVPLLPPTSSRLASLSRSSQRHNLTGGAAPLLELLAARLSAAEDSCEQAFSTALGSSGGIICSPGRHSSAAFQVYSALVSAGDESQILSRLGLVFNFAVQGDTLFVADVSSSPDLNGTLEAASLIAALAAGEVSRMPTKVVSPHSPCGLCAALKERYPELGDFEVWWIAPDSMASAPSASIVVVSAALLSKYPPGETFRAKARIVVYGTALTDATTYAPTGFRLQAVFNGGTGVAVFEREFSYWGHYYLLGSAPPAVKDVPRESVTFDPQPRFP